MAEQDGNSISELLNDDEGALNNQIRGKIEPVSREVAESPAPIDDPEDKVGQANVEKSTTQEDWDKLAKETTEELQVEGGGTVEAILPESAGIIDKSTLSTDDQAKLENFIGGLPTQKEMDFGVITVGHIARVCHESNRTYNQCIGDNSVLPWDSAPAWQKETVLEGVKKYLSGEINSPMEAHKSWMDKKYEEGWKFGEIKDAEAKTHPCLVPYASLPAEHQAKDFLFASVVQVLGLFIKKED